jgi:hypothetical protein
MLIDGIQSMKRSVCLVPEYVTVETPSIVRAPEDVYRYFAMIVPPSGATVHCTPSEGDFYIYGSWYDTNPTTYSHDFFVKSAKEQVMRFKIPTDTSSQSGNYTQAFMSLQGKESSNNGTCQLMSGLFCSDLKPMSGEGCPDENQEKQEEQGAGASKLLIEAILMVF